VKLCHLQALFLFTESSLLNVIQHKHSKVYSAAHNTTQEFIINWQHLEEPGIIDFTAPHIYMLQ
jgi:hypothetical protein